MPAGLKSLAHHKAAPRLRASKRAASACGGGGSRGGQGARFPPKAPAGSELVKSQSDEELKHHGLSVTFPVLFCGGVTSSRFRLSRWIFVSLPLLRQRHAIENETKKQWFPRNIAVFARNIAPVDIVLRALRKVWRFVAGFMIVLMRPLAEYMRPCGWGTKCISLKK